MKRIFLLTLFLSIGVGGVQAAEQTLSGPKWQLVVPDTKAPYVESLQRFLEGAENSYHAFFAEAGLSVKNPRHLKIRVFGNQGEYAEYRAKNSQSDSPYAFYSLFNSEVVTWPQDSEADLLANVFHEASHHYIRNYVSTETIPRCLDEGLAETFEAGTLNGSNVSPGRMAGPWPQAIRTARDEKHLKPFSFFLQMPAREFVGYKDANVAHLEIAQCWALTQYFIFAQEGRLRPIWRALLTDTRPVEVVIRENLPAGMTQQDLSDSWGRFIAGF